MKLIGINLGMVLLLISPIPYTQTFEMKSGSKLLIKVVVVIIFALNMKLYLKKLFYLFESLLSMQLHQTVIGLT